jgi:hypothetical protein
MDLAGREWDTATLDLSPSQFFTRWDFISSEGIKDKTRSTLAESM